MNKHRINKIISIFPEDINNVLDIGCKNSIFNSKFKTTTVDNTKDSNIKQDLNITQKLNLPDNSYDIVVLNQILEHLPHVEELIKESIRISKKYIYIGLPNELTYGHRIKFLFGCPPWSGYSPFGHKHFFTIDKAESFILEKVGNYSNKAYWFSCSGGKYIPNIIKDFLANLYPKLFAGEVYYLIKINSLNTSKEKNGS